MSDVTEQSHSQLAYGRTEWDDHHHLPTNTGLTNEKVTMWAFLGSDCLLFGALISTYPVSYTHLTLPTTPYV